MEHICIKPGCGSKYQSKDHDPYYCPDCEKAKQAIAKQVDAQIAARPRKETLSEWQQLERDGQLNVPGGKIVTNPIRHGR